MIDVIERLAGADPVASAPYEHPDLTTMTARITAHRPARPGQLLRVFRLRMAAAVSATTLVMVGAIAILQSLAPGLTVLALGPVGKFATTVTGAPDATMLVSARYHFIAGPAIDSAASSAPIFALSVPGNAAVEAARIANAFSVTGATLGQHDIGASVVVANGSGASVRYQVTAGIAEWTYANGTQAPPRVVNANRTSSGFTLTPAGPTFVGAAQRYLDRLGFNYDVAPPLVSWTSDPNLPVTAQPPLDRQVITFDISVAGTPTDLSVSFMFDPSGKLLWATGPDFGESSSTVYPLSSPRSAIAALDSQQSGSATTNVTLMSGQLSLRPFELADGTEWLLPTYIFSTLASGPPSKWWVVALDPRYLIPGAVPTSGRLTDGPVNY
ncbi:MAG TPA: hypothetical protein VMV96_03190 [Acidimicrobiales bacterium]|nr:hypothetical protein [Acidimicrobiales bacterium]